jgi:CRP-like cAMP-binding protein
MEVGLLRSAGVQPVSDLAVASQDVRFGPGETLFDRGTPRDRLYLVIEGEVEATREAPHVVRRAMAGEIVCGAASFGEPALAWKAVARGPVRALAFRVDDWFDLMEEHFDMVRSALAALSLAQEGLLEKQYG